MNNDFLNETIRFIVGKLNSKKINYYIVGAIGAYIDANVSFVREHEDLDLMIEEKDVEKLKDIFENSDFIFKDNRFNPSKKLNKYGYPEGEHEVVAVHKFSSFHIGFFLFIYNNSDYTVVEYFKDNDVVKKLERSLPIKYFNYQYNNEIKKYLNLEIKVVRKELIYKNKKVMNREKDFYDIKILEPLLDYEILDNLKGLSKIRVSKIIKV